jgi:hypothetical protein
MGWAVSIFLVRIKAEESHYEVGDSLCAAKANPCNTKIMVEVIKVCPNASCTDGQTQQ